MPDHIAIEVLADAGAGLLDDEQTGRITSHVGSCAECRDDWDALAGVSMLLGELPAPTMPAEVADRLTAVLAAEQTRSTGESASHPAEPVAGGAAETAAKGVAAASDGRGGTTTRPASLGGGTSHAHTLGAFGADLPRGRRSRLVVGALVACAAASVVGLGGYVLSATTGLNEPSASAPAVVSTAQLGAQAHALLRRADLTPHRFSAAWRCARQVTDGRITAITNAVVDGRPALLVYTRTEAGEEVTVVTGCDMDQPSAGPSTTLPR